MFVPRLAHVPCTLLCAGLLGFPAAAQQQAISIQRITTLPPRDKGNVGPSVPAPKLGDLTVPKSVRIQPPYAWNRTDMYARPDFDAFFPDDSEGGKQLDALFTGRLGGGHSPEDVLAAVRQGLKRTTVYKSQLLSQVGAFVWGAKEQDPRVIELMYHASDVSGPVSHEGMYYGLTILKDRTPNVMRAMVESFPKYGGSIQARIPWGFRSYGNQQETAKLLADVLSKPAGLSDNAITRGLDLYQGLTGNPFAGMAALSDRGRFAIGFTYKNARDESALRGQLEKWIDKDAIEALTVRHDGAEVVGVGLINGIANRNLVNQKAESDDNAKVLFAETFAPTVLQRRQLREFAKFLADGLPKHSRPVYAPILPDEKFAWNATDGYHPPNYKEYFPDDVAAGLELDQLYQQRESTELTARQQLQVIRKGLRGSSMSPQTIFSWASTISGWPADPMTYEILYHAADLNATRMQRYNAIYFGLSGLSTKPPNVLRLFAETIVREPSDPNFGDQTVNRVVWSLRTKAEKEAVAQHLDESLKQHEQLAPEKLIQVCAIYTSATGRNPTSYDQFADRGTFFASIRHRSLQTTAGLEEFCNKTFAGQPYYVHCITRDDSKSRGRVLVILRGIRGLQEGTLRLRKIDGVTVDATGPISRLQQHGLMPESVGEQAEHEDAKTFARAFRDLYQRLGSDYAHFKVKAIDWKAVGDELLPRSESLKNRREFCLLCYELVARLEDSHAYMLKGTAEPESIDFPRWDPGFACRFDAQQRPIVYHVDAGSPAQAAGLRVGMTLTALNGEAVGNVVDRMMREIKKYSGYSSDRYLRYQVAQWLGRQIERDASVTVAATDATGNHQEFSMKATMGVRYLPRLPVPMEGINESANVSWKQFDDWLGYLYVRRIRGDLTQQLDAAIGELNDCGGLVIDVRGNSGGGFDAARAFRNFDLEDTEEPERPRFKGRIAVLIDSRCISAGEGWVSWFRAKERAKFFGETTAGASSRKTTLNVLDGAYRVIYSVKAYRGFLDRPIERLGIKPDVPIYPTAKGLTAGSDEVLAAARSYLRSPEPK